MDETTATRIAVSMYVGEICGECKHEFDSVDDLIKRDPVCVGRHPLKFVCRECVI